MSRKLLQMAQQSFQQHPAVRTFVYATGILSAIPLGVFAMYILFTLIGSLMAAGGDGRAGGGGRSLLAGLAVLVPVEGTILVVAGGLAAASSALAARGGAAPRAIAAGPARPALAPPGTVTELDDAPAAEAPQAPQAPQAAAAAEPA
ncbi:hypothetical protein HK105_205812 [Polyrhizophydium stewartii]|uniref:Uncharacterized protein n=1 Tax=Polyrhizophydium stewartii TaxID=2732419 RepID=A0ABR4N574_9FUNG